MAALDSVTGHNHAGTANRSQKVNIGTGLTVTSQALGDIIYASSASAFARLAGNTTTTKKYLTQTGDGAASAAPAWGALVNTDLPAGSVVQIVNTQTGATSSGTTVMPYDDTIPQNTEGDEYITLAVTPTSATNKLKIDVVIHGAASANYQIIAALFQDTTAGGLACGITLPGNNDAMAGVKFTYYMAAGTTSATTFKVRVGLSSAGTFYYNGTSAGRRFGGVSSSSITITEIKV